MAKSAKGKNRFGDGLAAYETALGVASESIPPVVVISGDQEFLRARALRVIRESLLKRSPGMDSMVLSGESATLSSLLAELSGSGLFASDKLVAARSADKLLFSKKTDGENTQIERLSAWITDPTPGITLILEGGSFPRNRKLGKLLAEAALTIDCPQSRPAEAISWLMARAAESGTKIRRDAVEMLVQAHGADPGVLLAELEKLSVFTPDDQEIDREAVQTFLTGTLAFEIFGLTNAVEERDRPKATLYARRVTSQGTTDRDGKKSDAKNSAHQAIGMLANSMQNLLQARLAQSAGTVESWLASSGQGPWRAEKILAAAERFSLPELRRLTAYLSAQCKDVHDTGADPLSTLEILAVRLSTGT